jgi:hypothetical protein
MEFDPMPSSCAVIKKIKRLITAIEKKLLLFESGGNLK